MDVNVVSRVEVEVLGVVEAALPIGAATPILVGEVNRLEVDMTKVPQEIVVHLGE